MKNLLLIVAIVSNIVGCASVPMGDAKQDAALKRFEVSTEKAGIYIYRNESFGGGVKMDVELDGKPIGQTAAKTYLYKEVESGEHTVTSKAENTSSLKVHAKKGALIYIWQEVKMGLLYARTKLHLVDEIKGRMGVIETKLAETK